MVHYIDTVEKFDSINTQLRLFGKPEVAGSRRIGVALALGENIEQARALANFCAGAVKTEL